MVEPQGPNGVHFPNPEKTYASDWLHLIKPKIYEGPFYETICLPCGLVAGVAVCNISIEEIGQQMIEEPPLITIKEKRRRPCQSQIDAFQNVPSGFVVDALFGAGTLNRDIQPIGDGRDIECKVAGPALTADNGPADLLALHAALSFIQRGDVIVSSFGGHQGCASAGDSVMGMIGNNGGAGLVTDGPVRDYVGIVEVGLPVWCTGLTPASPFLSGPGKVGFAIQIGGQRVESGDMIVADRDGVVVVPFDRIDEAIYNLERVKEAEANREQAVANGLKLPAHVAELLKSNRTKFIR